MMRIVVSFILCFMLALTPALAANPTLPDANAFINAGLNNTVGGINTGTMISSVDTALSGGLTAILVLLYNIGLLVAVCVFSAMGILVLLANPYKKAELKASLYPYFIGLLLYIAGVPIAILIINIIISLFS